MGSVAFYIGSLKKGGAERVFVNLATYFLEQGCNVTMVTQYKKENEYERNRIAQKKAEEKIATKKKSTRSSSSRTVESEPK